jgi:hypothetical protein
LTIKFDYYTKYYSGRISTYRLDRTIVTAGAPRMLAISTRPASVGASSCASAAVASPPAAVVDVALSCAHAATTSSAARPQAPCSPKEQGAGAPAASRALQQWGLGYDSQQALPLCPTRLRRPLDGLRWRHFLHTRKISHQQVNRMTGTRLHKSRHLTS